MNGNRLLQHLDSVVKIASTPIDSPHIRIRSGSTLGGFHLSLLLLLLLLFFVVLNRRFVGMQSFGVVLSSKMIVPNMIPRLRHANMVRSIPALTTLEHNLEKRKIIHEGIGTGTGRLDTTKRFVTTQGSLLLLPLSEC